MGSPEKIMKSVRSPRPHSALKLLRQGALALAAALAVSAPSWAERLFTIEVISEGDPVAGATVCLGGDRAPAAYGGVVTDEKGQAVLLFPDRGPRLEPISELMLRIVPADGEGAIARIVARSEESLNPSVISVRTGVPVTCGRRLPIDGRELFSSRERSTLAELGVEVRDVRVIPAAFERKRAQRVHERMIEAAIQAEEEALERAREDEEIQILGRDERCFGAVGNGCGFGDTGGFAFCGFGRCSVNSGSWLHDQCCAANPNGAWCGGDNSEPNTCKAELDRGWDRMFLAPFTWERDVDFNRVNNTGRVERDLYCAPDGTILPNADANYCCTNYRELNGVEWAMFKSAKFLETLDDWDLRRCDADGDIVAILMD